MKTARTIVAGFFLLTNALFCAFQASAQHIKGDGNVQSQDRQVNNFNAIDCEGTFDVYLQQGANTSLKVEAESNLLSYIITEVKGSTLELKIKRGVNIEPSKHIAIYITTKELEAFNVSGVCKLQGQNTLTANNFELGISGVANMDLQLDVNSLKTNISGTGKLNLKGKSSNVDFQISGTGDIIASDLIADNANVRISGMGKMHINVQKQLKASVSGMGKIGYKGNPSVNESVSGMGKISKE